MTLGFMPCRVMYVNEIISHPVLPHRAKTSWRRVGEFSGGAFGGALHFVAKPIFGDKIPSSSSASWLASFSACSADAACSWRWRSLSLARSLALDLGGGQLLLAGIARREDGEEDGQDVAVSVAIGNDVGQRVLVCAAMDGCEYGMERLLFAGRGA